MAHIYDTSIISPPFLDSVSVVHEFIDVFPVDLLGMPLDCDIDFSIDVESGTKPNFIRPYRMAPTKLKELK